MYKHLTVALLVVALAALSQQAVTRRPTIYNPCQSDPTTTTEQTYSHFRTQLTTVLTTLGTVSMKCDDLKRKLKQRLDNSTIDMLDSPLVTVAGLPTGGNEPNLTQANNVSQFTEDYRTISIYIMYLQTASEQFTAGEHNLVTSMNAIKDYLYSWLCEVDRILRMYNSRVSTFVSSSVVTIESLTDSQTRLHYYYVLAKNAETLVEAKKKRYNHFLNTSSG